MKRFMLVCFLIFYLAVMAPISHAGFISSPSNATIEVGETINLFWTFQNELTIPASVEYLMSVDGMGDGANTVVWALGPHGTQLLLPSQQ